MRALLASGFFLVTTFKAYPVHAGQTGAPSVRAIFQAPAGEKLARVERYARLAAAAYKSLDAPDATPAGFVLLADPAPSASEVSGFLARTYRDTATGEVVVSFAGTDWRRMGTLVTDFALLASGVPAQFVQAEAYVKAVCGLYPANRIILVGHSLGGALAVFAGQRLKVSVIAFNAPFINDRLWAAVPGANRQTFRDGPWYLNFASSEKTAAGMRPRRDLVSSVRLWNGAAVEVVPVETGCGTDMLCHSIDRFEVADPATASQNTEKNPKPNP